MSFLAVVVDCNACNWGHLLEQQSPTDSQDRFQCALASIAAFCNGHMLSNMDNQLLVMAAGLKGTEKKLYCSVASTSTADDDEGHQSLAERLEGRLREAILESAQSEEDEFPLSSSYAGAISASICAFNRFRKEVELDPKTSVGRMVLVNLSKDLSGEHNVLMNLFFAAQQLQLEVDVAAVGSEAVVPILQQAADITRGTHYLVGDPAMLVQQLMKYSLGNSRECQDAFELVDEVDVDYRATCHCHNQLVEFGWVCSVCLAVHCKIVPMCLMCSAFFKGLVAAVPKRAKKRKKAEQ